MSDTAPTSARDQLAMAARSGIVSPRDRRIHALTTAGFGVATGLIPLLIRGGSALPQTILLLAYAVLLSLFSAWQARAASVPRYATRVGWAAAAASVVLIGVGIAVLAALDPATWWQDALVFLVVAAPMVAAGAVIARGARGSRGTRDGRRGRSA